MPRAPGDRPRHARVSVLFSEPKIPQSNAFATPSLSMPSFSALQRAENSSILADSDSLPDADSGFSALQRAENSSIGVPGVCSAR